MRFILTILIVAAVSAGGYYAYKNDLLFQGASGNTSGGSALAASVSDLKSLKDEGARGDLATHDDYEAVAEIFSSSTEISFGGFEPDGNGVVALDVTIVERLSPEVQTKIDELRIYGLDPAALTQISEGNSGLLMERIDARGVTFVGLEDFMERFLEAYMNFFFGMAGLPLADDAFDTGDETIADLEFSSLFSQTVETYEMRIGQIVAEGITIFPQSLPVVDGDVSDVEFIEFFRNGAKLARAFKIDAIASFDTTAHMVSDQAIQKSTTDMAMPFVGYVNYNRGDADRILMADLAYDIVATMPARDVNGAEIETEEASPFEMSMRSQIRSSEVKGWRVAKLLDYIARGEMPAKSETDILSLGVWRMEGESHQINGYEIISTASAEIDLSEFHWLAPTRISFQNEDAAYNVEGLTNYFASAVGMSPQTPGAAEMRNTMNDFAEIMKANGLAKVVTNSKTHMNWDPEDGAIDAAYYFDIEDFATFDVNAAGNIVDFDAISTYFPDGEGEADRPGFMNELQSKSALSSFSYVIEDKGGLEKGYNLAVEFSKLAPENPQDMMNTMLRNADPADLRISNAAMVRMMAPQMAQMMPAAEGFLIAIADFIQNGGTLKIAANPPQPVTLEAYRAAAEASQADPSQTVELLGLTIEHEPPQ